MISSSLKNKEHTFPDQQDECHSTSNPKPQTSNLKLQTPNLKLQTSNFKPQTSNFQTSNLKLPKSVTT